LCDVTGVTARGQVGGQEDGAAGAAAAAGTGKNRI